MSNGPDDSHAAPRDDMGEPERTPVYDGTVVDVTEATSDVDEAPQEAWVQDWPSAEPEPAIDPNTPEGAAIMRLFRTLKYIQGADGSWDGGHVIAEVRSWFRRLDIDPDANDPTEVGQRPAMAARVRPGDHFRANYGIQIGTDHDDPEPIIRRALHTLAGALGPGTRINLVNAGSQIIARLDHDTLPITD